MSRHFNIQLNIQQVDIVEPPPRTGTTRGGYASDPPERTDPKRTTSEIVNIKLQADTLEQAVTKAHAFLHAACPPPRPPVTSLPSDLHDTADMTDDDQR